MTETQPSDPANADPVLPEPQAFAQLGLSPKVLAAVRRMGYETPTEIQQLFIPAALTGKDCVGRAKTGTGKTAAFLLPIHEHFVAGEKIRALILAPTRELANQITVEAKKLAGRGRPHVLAVFGGTPMRPQIEKLRENPDIIVATPGRVMDQGRRGHVDFATFSIVVLDEVDRMFDMGFRQDIRTIIRQCKGRKQTLFLSATLPDDIMRLANQSLTDPIRISAGDLDRPVVETLDQRCYSVAKERKLPLLLEILQREKPELALVFTRTKRGADSVGMALRDHGMSATHIHGDLPQRKRDRALKQFREGKIHILVATDVMGRGIDVPNITHVINYDIPENPEDYLHRVGRSSRMDAPGEAITFVTPDQGNELTAIEMLCNHQIEPHTIPDFETGVVKRTSSPPPTRPAKGGPPRRRMRRRR